jgi:putative transcriptional regulator
LDPNFRRSVIFLSAHSAEEGAFGLVLNRPAGRTVGDLLPEQEMGTLSKIPVFIGGPVSADQLTFASFVWKSEANTLECHHHIGLEEAQALLSNDNATIRAFVGYAGWSKGQLEGEIAQKAWMLKKPEEDTLDLERTPNLWREITRTFGPWFKLVAEAPEDPSIN